MVMNTVTQFSLGKVKALPTTSTLKSLGHRRIKRCNGTVGFILFRHPYGVVVTMGDLPKQHSHFGSPVDISTATTPVYSCINTLL